MTYKEVSLLSDSIGQGYWDQSGIGWFGRLSQKIGAAYPYAFGFHNASMSGDTSIDALHRFSSEVQQRHGDYLIIAVGVNDLIRWKERDGQTSLSTVTSIVTWDQLLTRAVKSFKKTVVISCLPVIEDRFPEMGVLETPLYHRNDDIRHYNERVAELCAKHGVPHCNDLFTAMLDRAELFHDATHPNAAGHQLIADTVFPFLQGCGWSGEHHAHNRFTP